MLKRFGFIVFFFSFYCILSAQTITTQIRLGKSPLKDVIGAMTLQEKVRMVVGTANSPVNPPADVTGIPLDTVDAIEVNTLISEGKVAGSAGDGFGIPRLGIPSIVYADGPAGLRIDPKRANTKKTYYATAFPVASLLASTWDTSVVNTVGKAIGNEVLEYGVDVLLAPGMNIHRNPLGGRNFEYYSEDPILSGVIASSMVKGIQSNGVGTSIKHFAVNNQETNRNGIDVVLSERALREIYLKGFSIALKDAQPWTIMSSYNKINSVYASESHDLLTGILRNEWNFKGFVMTDWWGGHDAINQMKAGNDLLMPGSPAQMTSIINAVNKGDLAIEIIDRNVERILEIILKSPSFKNYKYSDTPDLKSHAKIATYAGTQGIILLKNKKNTLPVNFGAGKIAVFGNSSYDIISGGTGSGNVNKAYKVSLMQGLENNGLKYSNSLAKIYEDYITIQKASFPKESFWKTYIVNELLLDVSIIQKEAETNDVAILTIGRSSGEGEDRKLETEYYLSGVEQQLIQNISNAFHERNKKVIVILNIGGVIEVESWRDKVDAILLVWQPGQEAGNSISDVICGKVNPSGKLPVSFPIDYKDVPSAKNFPETGNAAIVKYEEGIYVGYRYYNSFHIKTAYEFGFGLSYTKFNYSHMELNSKTFKDSIIVKIDLKNTGQLPGKEIVQLYITAPSKNLDKPNLELKKFAKTRLLAPGESQTIIFTINASDLASFETNRSAWIAEKGEYQLKIGNSSLNIKETQSVNVPNELIVEKVQNLLIPKARFSELGIRNTAL